jgi:DNA-binding GntR family transcriptional regulator
MSQISRVTIKQQIYSIIKQKILTGEFDLGERINIDSLCRDVNVSNSPVREALSMLERDGLLLTSPHAGMSVTTLSEDAYNELTEMVQVLIVGAYDVCCVKGKIQLLMDLLRDCLQEMEKARQDQDHHEFIRAVLNFDRCFVAATENQKCINLFDSQYDLVLLAYLYNHRNRKIDMERNCLECQSVIEAVETGRRSWVADVVRNHFNKHQY